MFCHHPCSKAHLSSKNAVDHHNDEALQGVKHCKEDLEEGRTAVGDSQHGRHPGEGQQREDYTGAPEGRPGRGEEKKEKERSLSFWTSQTPNVAFIRLRETHQTLKAEWLQMLPSYNQRELQGRGEDGNKTR